MKATRQQVYEALDSERAYQNKLWNEETTTSAGHHSLEEWIVYIDHYIGIAKAILSTKPKQIADAEAAHVMRKIAALGVAAMEDHGAPLRVPGPPAGPPNRVLREGEIPTR